MNSVADPNDADIDLDEYWLFIRGKKITAKWSGEYAGLKTVDLSDSEESVDDWVVKKVVDKQLETLRKYGRVREIVTDRFGVIDKILGHSKQFVRLQKAFKRASEKFNQEEYPQTPEEIKEALQIGLIE